MDSDNPTSECVCFEAHKDPQERNVVKPYKLKRYLSIIFQIKVGDILTGTYHGRQKVAYCYMTDMGSRGPRYHFRYIVGKSPCGRTDEYSYQNELASMLNCGLKVQHKG